MHHPAVPTAAPDATGPMPSSPMPSSPIPPSPIPPRQPRLEAAIGWLAASALVFLIATVIVLVVESRERFIREERDRAESASHVLAEHAARLFDAADLLVERAAQATQDLSWTEIATSRRLWENLASEESRLPFLDAVWLNDEKGELRLSTVGFPNPPSNAADRDSFRAARANPERPYISELIVGRVTKKPTFLLSRGLTNRYGTFRGMASITVDPDYFADFYRRLDLPFDPVILLFRGADFGMLVRQPGDHPEAPAALADWARAAVRARPESGSVIGPDAIFSYRHVDNWPVYVAVQADLGPVLAARNARLWSYGGLAGAAALALLALSAFGFRQARNARLVQRDLEQRVRERTASLEAALIQRDEALVQQDLLMREVNHRIKNSLQVVSSLLSLQSQHTEDPELRARLTEAGRRVRAVSDIHQLLYKVEDVRLIPFHDYLTALCRDVERSALAEGGNWSLELSVEPVEVPTDQAVPLGLIANELLMNVVKHAYPGGVEPAPGSPKPITVGLTRSEGAVRLTVEDQGVGLPEGFDWRHSRSLGMRLVHALARQLGATLAVDPRPDGQSGASVTVQVPLVAAGGAPDGAAA